MPIAVAGWPTLNLGKSYDGPTHSQPPFNQTTPAVGHYFRQQFQWALNATCNDSSFMCSGVQRDDRLLPQAVFITGWNEWIAGQQHLSISRACDTAGPLTGCRSAVR